MKAQVKKMLNRTGPKKCMSGYLCKAGIDGSLEGDLLVRDSCYSNQNQEFTTVCFSKGGP